jgi:hypothetical protein
LRPSHALIKKKFASPIHTLMAGRGTSGKFKNQQALTAWLTVRFEHRFIVYLSLIDIGFNHRTIQLYQ